MKKNNQPAINSTLPVQRSISVFEMVLECLSQESSNFYRFQGLIVTLAQPILVGLFPRKGNLIYWFSHPSLANLYAIARTWSIDFYRHTLNRSENRHRTRRDDQMQADTAKRRIIRDHRKYKVCICCTSRSSKAHRAPCKAPLLPVVRPNRVVLLRVRFFHAHTVRVEQLGTVSARTFSLPQSQIRHQLYQTDDRETEPWTFSTRQRCSQRPSFS